MEGASGAGLTGPRKRSGRSGARGPRDKKMEAL
jgi:hypothetical protein